MPPALATASFAASAPLLSPVALTVSSDGSLTTLPQGKAAHKPCHGGKKAMSVSGVREWLMSALGSSRGDRHAHHDHHHKHDGETASLHHIPNKGWTVIHLMDEKITRPVTEGAHASSPEVVHGRPGFASVEDARLHHAWEKEQQAVQTHHLKHTAFGRFQEAMQELTPAEGMFVSFTFGAGLGVRLIDPSAPSLESIERTLILIFAVLLQSLMALLFKITRLLVQRRRVRKVEGRTCGRKSRKCRRAVRVAAREEAARQHAATEDEKAPFRQEMEQENADLPAYRDVEQAPGVKTSDA